MEATIENKINRIELAVKDALMANKIAELRRELLKNFIDELELHNDTISTTYIINKLKGIAT